MARITNINFDNLTNEKAEELSRQYKKKVDDLQEKKWAVESLIRHFEYMVNDRCGDRIGVLFRVKLEKFEYVYQRYGTNKSQYEQALADFLEYKKTVESEYYQSADFDDSKYIYDEEQGLREREPLTQQQKDDLRKMYRQASKMCHPDKVPEYQAERATKLFTELKEAFDRQNIEKVEDIYHRLMEGEFESRSSDSAQVTSVKNQVAVHELEKQKTAVEKLREIVDEYNRLYEENKEMMSHWTYNFVKRMMRQNLSFEQVVEYFHRQIESEIYLYT